MPTKTAPRKAAPRKGKPASTPPPQPRSLKEISVGRRDIRSLNLDDIEPLHIPGPNGGKPVRFNVREIDVADPKTRAELDELKALIREHGQKEPGRGHMQANGKFGLTDGERRSIVLRELRKEAPKDPRFRVMEVCPEPKGTTPEERDFDLLNCNSGVQLNMLEQGRLYLRRKDGGMKVADIAQKVAKTEQHIYDCLKLIGLPEEVTAAVKTGKIAGTTAVAIAKKVEPAQVASTVRTTIATATLQGKKKATNRHIPASTGARKKPKKKDDLSAAKTDLEKQEEKERMERVADYQADSIGKLQTLREATVRSRCVIDRYDTIGWVIDYLKGDKELPEAIDFLHGQEPLI